MVTVVFSYVILFCNLSFNTRIFLYDHYCVSYKFFTFHIISILYKICDCFLFIIFSMYKFFSTNVCNEMDTLSCTEETEVFYNKKGL